MPARALHLMLLAFCAMPFASIAQTGPEGPYGSARSSGYADINSLKQLKVVLDVDLADPRRIGEVLGFAAGLLSAAAENGPTGSEPIKIVVVSHGPELVVWDKKNYAKYQEVVDRAARQVQQGVRFEVCARAAGTMGLAPSDLHGFISVVPSGTYALTYWQNKGHALINPPTPASRMKNDLNAVDVRGRN